MTTMADRFYRGKPAADERFAADHAPGNRTLTASRWPALALPPDARPAWLPSPFALGAHMAGLVPLDQGEKAHLRRGKLLEPVGARLAAEDYGLEIVAEQERVERSDIPALAYIDLGTTQGRVELKTVNDRDFAQWNGKPPLYPRTQAQCQMAITGDEWCYVGAIVIGYMEIRLELFEERRHDGMQDLLLDRAEEFLRTLERGDLPPMDEAPSSYAAWAAMMTLAEGETIRLLDPESVERAAAWRSAKAAASEAKKIDEASKAWFATRCGDAETIELPDGTVLKRARVSRDGYAVAPTSYIQWKLK
jgi:hypothetical protein